jgi:hypothetical protein
VLQALAQPADIAPLPLLIDVLDDDLRRQERLSWRQAITHQVSQTCAAYFDRHQADWQPERGAGLFAFWRDSLVHDHGIGWLMGLPALHEGLHALPETRQQAERWALERQGLDPAIWADYLEAVLWTVQGWAGWCAYLGWQAQQQGGQDEHLRDLLAIRLAWGALLLECKTDRAAHQAPVALQQAWQHAPQRLARAERRCGSDEVWQVALEQGYQRGLAQALRQAPRPGGPPARRGAGRVLHRRAQRTPAPRAGGHLAGGADPGLCRLLRRAGGLHAAGHAAAPPAAAGPAGAVDDDGRQVVGADGQPLPAAATAQAAAARQQALARAHQQGATSRWPGTAFSYVEAAGLGYLGGLFGWLRPPPRRAPGPI